ncbi:MAG TPA: hypothetical protein VLC98_05405 [Phnomibacter sp.]|nr:hypothetical protein [Phnomibacter sp.]
MLKKVALLVSLVTLFAVHKGHAQRPTKADIKRLHQLDDSLQDYGIKMLDELLATDRLRADSMFTRLLVRTMRIPYSFYVAFDSMQMAPVLYPEDSSFRIITWHLQMNDDNFRQKGVIQYNTPDGSAKFVPLFDVSDYSENPLDSIRNNQNWIGAVYYKLLEHHVGQQPVYTLLGYDENSELTTKKWIETLTFSASGEPKFGGDYFQVGNDSIFPRGSKRFVIEYKKEGRARINYDDDDSLIVIDNLVSESGEPDKKYTLIPGGDYEAFKWDQTHWKYIDKLFMEQRGDGNEPKPALILNDEGVADENILQAQTEKNIKTAEAKEKKAAEAKAPASKTPAKKKPPVKTGG